MSVFFCHKDIREQWCSHHEIPVQQAKRTGVIFVKSRELLPLLHNDGVSVQWEQSLTMKVFTTVVLRSHVWCLCSHGKLNRCQRRGSKNVFLPLRVRLGEEIASNGARFTTKKCSGRICHSESIVWTSPLSKTMCPFKLHSATRGNRPQLHHHGHSQSTIE